MKYNDLITYNEPSSSYIGTIILNIKGIANPVILNNINIFFGGSQDFSVSTTIAVLTIDVNPSGIITIETLQSEAAAIMQAESITIHSGTLISIGSSNDQGNSVVSLG